MPQLLWSLTAAPRQVVSRASSLTTSSHPANTISERFDPGNRVCGRYKIQSIVDQDSVSQVVHARKKDNNSQRVLKIITRARVNDVDITEEIAWLKNTCSFHEEFSKFLGHHTDMRYFYLVFDKRPRTLQEVIADTTIHLSRRNIIEIAVQIINATQHLNNSSVFDIDLCPANIEVTDQDTTESFYSYRANSFQSRDRTALFPRTFSKHLAYFGRVGKDPLKTTMSERHKSPEHVYDMIITAASNIFSISCIIAELLLRKPLFPLCRPGPLYTREKTVVFDTVLGPFSDAMIRDIRRSFKGVFKYDNSDYPQYDGVSEPVTEFCKQAEPLKVIIHIHATDLKMQLMHAQYLILEEFASDVVECMTHLDSSRRVPLPDILHHPFFDVTSL